MQCITEIKQTWSHNADWQKSFMQNLLFDSNLKIVQLLSIFLTGMPLHALLISEAFWKWKIFQGSLKAAQQSVCDETLQFNFFRLVSLSTQARLQFCSIHCYHCSISWLLKHYHHLSNLAWNSLQGFYVDFKELGASSMLFILGLSPVMYTATSSTGLHPE